MGRHSSPLDVRGLREAVANSSRRVHPVSPFRACRVSFVERAQRHVAEVDAETTYEAAALVLKFWRTRRFVKGPSSRAVLEVEVDRPARLLVAVKMTRLLDWLYKLKPKTPEEAARIQRLRGLLADDRH
jgi:hypothetical protein